MYGNKAIDTINEFSCRTCNAPAKMIDYGLGTTQVVVYCPNRKCAEHNVVRTFRNVGEYFSEPTLTE